MPARNDNHELMCGEAKGVSNYIDPGCLIQKMYHIRKFTYIVPSIIHISIEIVLFGNYGYLDTTLLVQ